MFLEIFHGAASGMSLVLVQLQTDRQFSTKFSASQANDGKQKRKIKCD